MSNLNRLKEKLADHTAVVGIVGLGYVGLPLSIRFSEAGFKVIGFDIDPEKPPRLNRGQSIIRHIPNEKIKAAVAAGFEATCDFARAAVCDALILCVPTPLNDKREPDISFVINTTNTLLRFLKPGQAVVLESTTYPGTTEEELKPRIESTGLKIGQDIALIYSPEREDPGNPDFTTRTIPKVIGGSTPACLCMPIRNDLWLAAILRAPTNPRHICACRTATSRRSSILMSMRGQRKLVPN